MLNFVYILALSFILLHNVRAICRVCNPNGVACISEKEYQICAKGEVNTSATFSCLGENEICTDHVRICVNKTLTSGAQACLENNSTYTTTTDTKTQGIPKTTQNSLTTTPQPITTTTQDPAELFCLQQSKEGRYPYPDDLTSKRYIYCFRWNGVWRNRVGICSKGMYFNHLTLFCESISKTTQKIITTTPQPIMGTKQDPAELFCSQQSKEGRYPYPGDLTLKRYIYCFKRNGVWQKRVGICSNGMYFNQLTLFCQNEKWRTPIS